jgi:hypothetical protein
LHSDPPSPFTFGGITGATDGFGGRHTAGGQTIGLLTPSSHTGCSCPSTHWQVQAAFAALPPINNKVSANRIDRIRYFPKCPDFPSMSRRFIKLYET